MPKYYKPSQREMEDICFLALSGNTIDDTKVKKSAFFKKVQDAEHLDLSHSLEALGGDMRKWAVVPLITEIIAAAYLVDLNLSHNYLDQYAIRMVKKIAEYSSTIKNINLESNGLDKSEIDDLLARFNQEKTRVKEVIGGSFPSKMPENVTKIIESYLKEPLSVTNDEYSFYELTGNKSETNLTPHRIELVGNQTNSDGDI